MSQANTNVPACSEWMFKRIGQKNIQFLMPYNGGYSTEELLTKQR